MGQGGRPYVRRGANVSAWPALVQMYLYEHLCARSAGQILLEAQIAIVGRQTLQSAYTADLGSPPCLFNWTIILSSVCLLIATLALSLRIVVVF